MPILSYSKASSRAAGGSGGGGERPNLFGGSSSNLFDEARLRQSTLAKDTSAPLVIPRLELAPSSHSRLRLDETHHDVIKRILFVYAKLNPGIRYVQGMNEILAPVYYVFAHNGPVKQQRNKKTNAKACRAVLASP